MVSELQILNLAFVPLSDEDDAGGDIPDAKDLDEDEDEDEDGVEKAGTDDDEEEEDPLVE